MVERPLSIISLLENILINILGRNRELYFA
jgi:hypothetical protein